MKMVSLTFDDALDAALEAVCAREGRDKSQLVRELVRKYVEAEHLKRVRQDPSIANLYEQLAEQDVALAEEGLDEYRQGLENVDKR